MCSYYNEDNVLDENVPRGFERNLGEEMEGKR